MLLHRGQWAKPGGQAFFHTRAALADLLGQRGIDVLFLPLGDVVAERFTHFGHLAVAHAAQQLGRRRGDFLGHTANRLARFAGALLQRLVGHLVVGDHGADPLQPVEVAR